jgi:hypothetical protein
VFVVLGHIVARYGAVRLDPNGDRNLLGSSSRISEAAIILSEPTIPVNDL